MRKFLPSVLALTALLIPQAMGMDRMAVLSKIPMPALAEDEVPPEELGPVLHWRNALHAFSNRVAILPLDQLSARVNEYDLLVLPAIETLSQGHKEALLGYLQRGGFLILTGRGGAFSDTSSGGTLADALSLNYTDAAEAANDASTWWAVMDRPSALTAGIPRMQHLSVETTQPITLGKETGTRIASWLSGGGGSPDYVGQSEVPAIVAGTHGRGNFLWLGFDLDAVGGDLPSSQTFHMLLENALSYFKGLPTLDIAPWPFPFTRAILISMDVEEQFGNIQNVEALPNLTPITYFILTNPAGLYEQLLKDIALSTDVKKEIAVHGDNHDIFRGQPMEKQIRRLTETRDFLAGITGVQPRGFRPPEEAYDFFTLQAVADAGYEYLLANDSADRAQPRIMTVGNKEIVQFTMLNKDDVKMIIMDDYPSPAEVLNSYIKDADSIFDREGLYITNFHSQILAVDRYIGVLQDFISYVERRNAWITTGREIANWWLDRESVRLVVNRRERNHLVFRLENPAEEAIEDLALDIWLPRGASNPRIESPPGGRRVLDYQEDNGRLRLHVPLLLPRDTREYEVLWLD